MAISRASTLPGDARGAESPQKSRPLASPQARGVVRALARFVVTRRPVARRELEIPSTQNDRAAKESSGRMTPIVSRSRRAWRITCSRPPRRGPRPVPAATGLDAGVITARDECREVKRTRGAQAPATRRRLDDDEHMGPALRASSERLGTHRTTSRTSWTASLAAASAAQPSPSGVGATPEGRGSGPSRSRRPGGRAMGIGRTRTPPRGSRARGLGEVRGGAICGGDPFHATAAANRAKRSPGRVCSRRHVTAIGCSPWWLT